MKWTHNGLAHDLAEHLRASTERLCWEDMQLGPSGSPRPDVYTMQKSYSRFCPIAYEVKVSVADFRRDVTAGKWQSYLQFSGGVTFAVPAGLIAKEDVPKGCGLMVRGPNGWTTVKAPTLQKVAGLPQSAWIKLLIDGIERQSSRAVVVARSASPWLAERKLRKRFGDRIGDLLSNLINAENRILRATAEAEKQAKEIDEGTHSRLKYELERVSRERQRVDTSLHALARALGLPADTSPGKLADAAYDAAHRLAADNEVRRLQQQLKAIKRAFEDGLEPLPGLASNDNAPVVPATGGVADA